MGPSRARDQKLPQDDVKVLLREKDDRIATLETRLEAYSARASTAHIRLLKTIDVLDSLRTQHALEISAEEQAKLKLVQEVNRWRNMAKDLEVEKDELKDVVEDLIEKAGCTSLNMQQGNLIVESPEQVAVGATDVEGKQDDHNNDLLAFATSIIARLRTELECERQCHSKTVEVANLRIEELEAKIAVREAELEKCVTSPSDHDHHPGELQNVSTHALEKPKQGKNLPKPKPISDEECLRFLESNSARNRALEIEIPGASQDSDLSSQRLSRGTSATNTAKWSPSYSNTQSSHKKCFCRSKRSVAPVGCWKSHTSPGITFNNAFSSPTGQPNTADDVDRSGHKATKGASTLSFSCPGMLKINIAKATDGINMDTFQDVLRVEGECVRLQAEVDDLREQLQHARSFARAREKVLLREMAQLRASSSSSSVLHPTQDLHHIFSPQPLEADIATEESMELASPLMPTVIPDPLPAHSSQSLDAEADLVSFPFSPGRAFSPALEAPTTPPRDTRRSPGPQDIERVQAALDVARTHLAQKEEALVQLRAEMERLQQELQVQTQGNGDGG
ncbi:hypothetical protein EV363DRAFT_1452709 [Boletus edulis]|nr:hypothetical protein EV363DRAFT_1452709 [Boletus edulis]